MSMWVSNNQQFLFTEKNKHEHVLRIVGREKYEYFKRAGLDGTTFSHEATQYIEQIIEQNPDLSDDELEMLKEAAMEPIHKIIENPNAPEEDHKVKPKLRIDARGETAELSIVPKDLEGTYDYIPDVKSMSSTYTEEMARIRQKAIEDLTTNQMLIQQLAQEGYRAKVKDTLVAHYDELGFRGAERLFEKIQGGDQNGKQNQITQMGYTPTQLLYNPVRA